MELKIFDRNLDFIKIIDNAISLTWTRRLYDVGECSLKVPFNFENVSILKKDNIICKGDDFCYIESVEIIVDDSGEYINIAGKTLNNYLERRVIYGSVQLEGNAVDNIYKLVNTQCIQTEPDRVIPLLTLSEEKPEVSNINNIVVTYENLLDEVKKICKNADLGFKIVPDLKTKRLVFSVYKGMDRSINQNVLSHVIFSRNFENILSQNYLESLNGYKNVVYVNANGDDENTYNKVVGTAKGLDRFEDVSDITVKDTVTEKVWDEKKGEYVDDTKTIPNLTIMGQLEESGKQTLKQNEQIRNFEGSIFLNNATRYKEDFDLGDNVTVLDSTWQVQFDVIITDIIEQYTQSEVIINIEFGKDLPTFKELIKNNR